MYFDAGDRLREALEAGAITIEEYKERARKLGTWLDEHGVTPWPHPECGYVHVRNPSA